MTSSLASLPASTTKLLSASDRTIEALISSPFVVSAPCRTLADLIREGGRLTPAERERRLAVGQTVAKLSHCEAWSAAALLAILQPEALDQALTACWGWGDGDREGDAVVRIQRVVSAQAERLKALQEALRQARAAARAAPAPAPAPVPGMPRRPRRRRILRPLARVGSLPIAPAPAPAAAAPAPAPASLEQQSEIRRLRAAVAALQTKLKASRARQRAAEQRAAQLHSAATDPTRAAADVTAAGAAAIARFESAAAAALARLAQQQAPQAADQQGPQLVGVQPGQIVCGQCGTGFQPRNKANRLARFCSDQCRLRFHAQRRPPRSAPPQVRRCCQCGQAFETTLQQQATCSKSCAYRWRLPIEKSIRRLMAEWPGSDGLALLSEAVAADGLTRTATGLGVRSATLQEAMNRLSREAGGDGKPVQQQTPPPP